jgi:hypothetical protein
MRNPGHEEDAMRLVSARWVVSTALALISLTAGEQAARAEADGPWTSALRELDGALARKEYTAALRLANDAHALALATARWDGMVAAGEAYRRIGEVTGLRASFDAKAREAYRKALFRARQQGSVDGVLRVTEAYAALGDAQTVAIGLRAAERLAAGDADALARLRVVQSRLGDPGVAARGARP